MYLFNLFILCTTTICRIFGIIHIKFTLSNQDQYLRQSAPSTTKKLPTALKPKTSMCIAKIRFLSNDTFVGEEAL